MSTNQERTIDRRRLLHVGGVTAVAALGLVATGVGLAQSEPSTPAASPNASPEASPGASPVASATTFTVEMVELAFKPSKLTVPADTDITIELKNTGVLAHDFMISSLDISSGLINPGETGSVQASIPAGSYEFICSVEGHADAGMYGTLTAE